MNRIRAWLRRRRWRELSLRGRLIVLVAGAVAVAVAGVSLLSWLLVGAKLEQNFDNQLRSYSALAATASSPAEALRMLQNADRGSTDPDGDDGEDHRPRDPLKGNLWVQFVSPDGTPTTISGHPTTIPVTPLAAEVARGTRAELSENLELGERDHYRVWTVPRNAGGVVQVGKDAGGLRETLAELRLWHFLVGLAGVGAAAAVGLLVARTALRPVDLLTAGAERVARTQDLDSAIPVQGSGEIARLAEAFNAMLAALADSRNAQRRLVEDAGHELRTPLTSLRNNIELLVHTTRHQDPTKSLPREDRDRLLGDLEKQAEELTTLVGELVDLAKADRSPETTQKVDLSTVVEAAVARARPRAHDLTLHTDLTPTTVQGRPKSLERAVLNLLDNAIKWSPPQGHIKITLHTGQDGLARVVVEDQGPGIAPEDLPHIFERFYRAATARSQPGSGLGLAIVDQIATLHHGYALAGPADPQGTRVVLALPTADPA
ncbi:two-component system sensor histidine kinase MprB [Crossiella equi]|uniref:histidine kinase n=1 Tax=Crossiella equi TaxID=130796 RepID=A0ABS5ARJ6_9PSEU|nr:HAMP domain-containing sensor histidine kinase [Crossiella equi]MBP2479194.1 two-component system sensor histidine kinase MprB [Crossiella equi]